MNIRWAEVPEDERVDVGEDTEAHRAASDESLAVRRLRRWLKGMFGGEDDTPDVSSDRDNS